MRRHARKAPPLGLALDPAGPDPLHRQIGEQLRRAILERRLAPGTSLPSSRLMADELNCARGTVLTALDQLIAEGYLVARAGSGLWVAANLPDEMLVTPAIEGRPSPASAKPPGLSRRGRTLLLREPPPQAPFADQATAFPLGQPDRHAFPFPLWAKLLDQEWRNPAWEVAGAPHPFGHAGLRSAIAAYLGMARGFGCDPRTVVVTSGVRQSLNVVARIVLDPDEQVWIEEPCFRGTREALAWADVKAVGVPIDAAGFDVEAALSMAPDARLAVVAPSHQFPLGTVLSLQRRLALLSWAERSGGWIVEDDFDGEYRYSGRPLAPLRALDRSDRVAYLGSFSKLLFPALRLSFLVLPQALVPAAEKIMASLPDRASLLGQGALARFIADGHLGIHLRRTRLLYAKRQQALIEAADRHLAGLLEIARDAGGMHLIARPHPDLDPVFNDRDATAAAAALSVSVAPLSECYSDRRKVQGLILGYAGTPDEEIDPAIRKLGDALCMHHRNDIRTSA
ncbi:GntR family transcriptional regulator / MocR family aminotransferase [Enhydrobacter aerosaccus]|uniref:GntR family transcriptional regulator / MocR family aminotransferase n=1 Tax=Enhydrobacter aerosaccus TaxID=225324 RepID=A0A1T4KZV7_9HYPH|nr:PLP-dependent aminotransferase family protein [Enhydrobacter aerosaccus]SJZ47820.1 GntR family transcriptional regulator / MocR family aminotransferase [Enhydrobacter aerosaccus]